jgi:hypothetical protein
LRALQLQALGCVRRNTRLSYRGRRPGPDRDCAAPGVNPGGHGNLPITIASDRFSTSQNADVRLRRRPPTNTDLPARR